jgi:hypothetical protein
MTMTREEHMRRMRDREALRRFGLRYYDELAAEEQTKVCTFLEAVRLGNTEGRDAAVAYLRTPATSEQEAEAQRAYGVPYKQLCCDRRKAVDAACACKDVEAVALTR